jgi:electron transfer flavoprotein-quinone oxidoreductase
MEEAFDCIIVGGGIAGLSAAMILARNDAEFLLIERGEFSGSKNVSGGVLWGEDLARLVPEYWTDDSAAFERFITHRRLTLMDEDSAFSLDYKSDGYAEPPYMGVSVLRSRFDHWLADQVEDAIAESAHPYGSFLATNVRVDEVLQDENGRATGIRAGDETFHADSVIIAEGVNNLLTRQVGLHDNYVPADHMMVGVKEVIGFDQSTLEDRFQLNGDSGITNEFVGAAATSGVEGGGFLYTNEDTVSIGLVLGMADLREKGTPGEKDTPYQLLTNFKQHPVVRDMIQGGEVLEYSAHTVSNGDIDGLPREIYDDGLLVAGEAANLLMNAGKAIRGMDYAMRSGILAAETVIEAKEAGDFSADMLQNYRAALESSFVLKDMRRFQNAVHLLHRKEMVDMLPALVCDVGRKFFQIDSSPSKKVHELFRESVNEHASYWDLVKLGYKATRAL